MTAMKMIFAALTGLALILTTATAEAKTCRQHADTCWAKSSKGPNVTCYAADRLSQCEASGTYISPKGDSYPATPSGKPKGKK